MHRELLKPKLKAGNYKEVIRVLGEALLKSGYVSEAYIEAVLQREKSLPTGLQVGCLNVAIPHTDSTHVHKSAIALATLEAPVRFCLMANPAKEVEVSIVFLLAVREPKEQVELLKRLMELFQNEETLSQIKNTDDSQTILAILEPVLSK